ncbi:MAG: HEAT repeat domain-containing protein, partial [Lentisphaeria bacterium]|nr:hypothetical protein [Lentisphaeria bacterium]NQZ68408.1 HEAT repeat domain-containing protein [Lentisphaeria bacterium]
MNMHNSRLLIILVSGTLTLNSLMAAGDDWMLIAAEIKSQSKENTPQSRAKLWVRYKQEKQVWMKGRILVALAFADPKKVTSEVSACIASKDAVLRIAAYEALGLLGDKAAIEQLKKAIDDADPAARLKASSELARLIPKEAWALVKDKLPALDKNTATNRIKTLAVVNNADADKLIQLSIAHKDPTIRLRAINALKNEPRPWIVETLIRHNIKERDKTIKRCIRAVLLTNKPEALSPALCQIFASEKKELYSGASTLLFDRPSTKAGDILAELLRKKSTEIPIAVVIQSMDALLIISPKRYTTLLTSFKNHKNPQVRVRSISALTAEKEEEEDLYKLLKGGLSDPADIVFHHCLHILKMRTQAPPKGGVIPYFTDALKTKKPKRLMPLFLLIQDRLQFREADDALVVMAPHLGSNDDKLRKAAAKIFSAVADDPLYAKVAALQGYLTKWAVLGPFPNTRTNDGFDKLFPPEKEIDLKKSYESSQNRTVFFDEDFDLQDQRAPGQSVIVKWQRF